MFISKISCIFVEIKLIGRTIPHRPKGTVSPCSEYYELIHLLSGVETVNELKEIRNKFDKLMYL